MTCQTKRRILYLTDYLPTPNDAQSSLIESFIQDLEKLLGIERTELSLAEMWRNTAPEPINDINLPVYLESVSQSSRAVLVFKDLMTLRLPRCPITKMPVAF